MKADIRRIWLYMDCQVVPVDCQHPTWGKCGEPKSFGDGICRNRYWRIEFPDGSWVHTATKKSARDYIDNRLKTHPENFVVDIKRT